MPGGSSTRIGNRAVCPADPPIRPRSDAFFGWPGWHHLGYFVFLAVAQTLLFWLVYGGADYVTARRALRLRIHLDVEQRIPFIPEAVVIYVSIFALIYAAPFVLRSRQELRALAATLATVTLCAGVGFLLFPAELGFPEAQEFGACAGLFHFADRLNLDYNFVPSLHVAMSVVCAGAFATRASVAGKVVLWAWAAAIAASTLITHQHHVLDVVTGLALGVAALKLVYCQAAQSDPRGSAQNSK